MLKKKKKLNIIINVKILPYAKESTVGYSNALRRLCKK